MELEVTPPYKPPIAVDFDGVLWNREKEESYFGAVEFLRALHTKYYVVIFSARAAKLSGENEIFRWGVHNKVSGIIKKITYKKELNFVRIIDDKALMCDGTNYGDILRELL